MAELLLKAEKLVMAYPDTTIGFGMFKTGRTGSKLAINNVSLELRKGENLALIGANGSGKSTLLRILAGIYPVHSGSVEDYGNSVQTLFNMGIGMKPEMTGRQNITIMSMIGGKSTAEIEKIMPEVIAFSDLGAVIDHPVRTYSRGMAMRLSFAVATSLQPEILLIDEWIGAGDEKFRRKAQKRLDEMVTTSKGFVLASHNASIVQQYCVKALWLDDGKVKMMGPSEDVIKEYIASARGRKLKGVNNRPTKNKQQRKGQNAQNRKNRKNNREQNPNRKLGQRKTNNNPKAIDDENLS